MNSMTLAFFRCWSKNQSIVALLGVGVLGFAMSVLVYQQKMAGTNVLPYSAPLCSQGCSVLDENIVQQELNAAKQDRLNLCAHPKTLAQRFDVNSDGGVLLGALFDNTPIHFEIEETQLVVQLEKEIKYSLFGWSFGHNDRFCISPKIKDPGKLFLILLALWGALNFGVYRAFDRDH